MGEVVYIREFISGRAVRRVRDVWRVHFPEELTGRTRLEDLSAETLLTLARLEQNVMTVVYDLIMGVLGLGPESKFQYLSGEPKMRVLDTSLFFIDQIRWECLRRLGWAQGFAGEEYTIVELILNCREIKAEFTPPYPQLVKPHPNYEDFSRHRGVEGEAMVRSLIPAALAALGQKA
ncbi:MAG: hypothetical protein DRP62_07785 [Planctomycetota bacterium]|nr:MAG: hypothetical protein DRP62_07785 [Planctomycetota bacterium]